MRKALVVGIALLLLGVAVATSLGPISLPPSLPKSRPSVTGSKRKFRPSRARLPPCGKVRWLTWQAVEGR
jgi:hypothetical protein